MSRLHSILRWTQSPQTMKALQPSSLMKSCCACFNSRAPSSKENDNERFKKSLRRVDEFEAPSPYKNPGPRRYGFNSNYKTQGCLPRDGKPVRNRPQYSANDRWEKKSSLFGQMIT